MKRIVTIVLSVAIALATVTMPAFAVDQRAEAQFQRYLSEHPELQRNPALMNNPSWRAQHKPFIDFLNEHPQIRQQAAAMARGEGAYYNGRWYNQNQMWNQHPNWVRQHRPEWVKRHPEWTEHHGNAPYRHGYPGNVPPTPAPGYHRPDHHGYHGHPGNVPPTPR